jgi:hypothetical protein
MMVINYRAAEHGRPPPLARPCCQKGEVLLYAANSVGLLLVVTLIPIS